ncbi:hypothetical protein OEB99_14380 [Actinotalea sp. M2MS4P-6]|uniref:hypothetical protein n=1 Tax=Actinotalea sp. M2MS4P-6 TaxID=2983762 RepID=UPI0021E4C00A|nr:hypothetical protein [Actinotalea sp. M2MS4P-6]MCV2395500.1 hypothetical protein [Actinotalea sp. M2MS4P-6]
MPLFRRAARTETEVEAAPYRHASGEATDDEVVAPSRAPQLPDGWTYRFSSPAMGTARIDIRDGRGRLVASEPFVGHAQSPEFLIAAACTGAHRRWQADGGGTDYIRIQNFTASANPEGAGWRVWCNQALGVSVIVSDLADAEAHLVSALAAAKDLEPDEIRVSIVN